jgi:hypothetical protein
VNLYAIIILCIRFVMDIIKTESYRIEVLAAVVMKSSDLWDIMPCSLLKVSWHFRETCCLHLRGQSRALIATCFTLISSLAYSLTLKMKATCSSKTLVDFQRTTRCYSPEDKAHQKYSQNSSSFWMIFQDLGSLSELILYICSSEFFPKCSTNSVIVEFIVPS